MPSAKSNLIKSALICLVLALANVTGFAQSALEQAALDDMATGALPDIHTNINTMPAKKLFGHERTPANLYPHAIGTYAKGCAAGAAALPLTGPAWQVMRTSRHRNYAMPQLITLLERFAIEAKQNDGWNGMLVGDMAQPRGGPMLTGHASHQIGLDADIWFTPMPERILTKTERENMVATIMVKNRKEINSNVWNESRDRIIKRAASYPEVGRIFVHPPIKAELCKWATGDRSWLAKVRPLYGHNYHFHIRMKCPKGMKSCVDQWAPNPADGTGCGKELAYWMSDVPWVKKKRDPNAPPYIPPPPLTLSGLPAECRAVIAAP
jgi:penicillin-insensitive murein DD-endopeptidase